MKKVVIINSILQLLLVLGRTELNRAIMQEFLNHLLHVVLFEWLDLIDQLPLIIIRAVVQRGGGSISRRNSGGGSWIVRHWFGCGVVFGDQMKRSHVTLVQFRGQRSRQKLRRRIRVVGEICPGSRPAH